VAAHAPVIALDVVVLGAWLENNAWTIEWNPSSPPGGTDIVIAHPSIANVHDAGT
jgi:hypothetical protein